MLLVCIFTDIIFNKDLLLVVQVTTSEHADYWPIKVHGCHVCRKGG